VKLRPDEAVAWRQGTSPFPSSRPRYMGGIPHLLCYNQNKVPQRHLLVDFGFAMAKRHAVYLSSGTASSHRQARSHSYRQQLSSCHGSILTGSIGSGLFTYFLHRPHQNFSPEPLASKDGGLASNDGRPKPLVQGCGSFGASLPLPAKVPCLSFSLVLNECYIWLQVLALSIE
jgi:hypothetical protein